MRLVYAVVTLLLVACTNTSGTVVLDEPFASIGEWVTISGSAMLDTTNGNPAPCVNIGEPNPTSSPYVNVLRNNTTFPEGPTTISADVEIDQPMGSDSAYVGFRAIAADASAWVGFEYVVQPQSPTVYVDGCLGLSSSGGGCVPKFMTPLNADTQWHKAEIVLKDGGAIDYRWDGVVQGSSGSTFVGQEVLHVEILGASTSGATGAHIDNIRVTSN